MANAEYDAWLVDLDGTLYTQRWVRLAMAAELALFGWSALPILKRFRREQEALREQVLAGEMVAITHASPFHAQLGRTAEALGMALERVEGVVQDWMFQRPSKWIRLFPRTGVIAEVRAFKAKGGRTALVSDYPAERKIDALGLRELFDVIVASGEVHGPQRLKPDPEGFLNAAALLNVAPDRCLVVGDRDDADGAAARAAKMAFRLV
ncbi:MAG TPA: HAD-IA family hydrolase [Polyangiaceae bacterium]